NLTVNLNLLNGLSLGTYTLMSAPAHTGTPTFTVNRGGPGDNPLYTYTVSLQGDSIVLGVGGGSDQKWTNGAATGLWNTTDANWDPAVNGGIYADNAHNQVFDDSAGAANGTVSIPA